jgi:molybdopterin molybdotransferase
MQDQIAVSKACFSGENIIFAGSDVQKGDLLVPKGKQLRPQEVGALAAAGITFPQVVVPLRISIISTGDEVVAPEMKPMPGQIRDINTYALSSLAITHGFSVVDTRVVPDDAKMLLAAVALAMKESDVVAVSGGSSRGEKDATRDVFREISDPGVFLYGLAMKPGKPTILAYDKPSSTLLVGLPGHPAAALMVFKRIIADAWLSFLGTGAPLRFSAVMASNIPGAPGRETCVPVRIFQDEKGTLNASAVFGESGLITTLTESDGYVVIGRNDEGLKKGETVSVRLF